MQKVKTFPSPPFSIAGEGDTVHYFQSENGDDWINYSAVSPEGAMRIAKHSLPTLFIAVVSGHEIEVTRSDMRQDPSTEHCAEIDAIFSGVKIAVDAKT